MNKKGFVAKDVVLTSNDATTITSLAVPDNVDQVLVAVNNGYSGSEKPTVTLAVFVQFDFGGAWWSVSQFEDTAGAKSSPVPLSPGSGFWGLIPNVGVSGVKIVATRSGSVNVPVGVEIKFLENSVAVK